ncbi:ANTAR domain-containing protein [Angustibacter aerolatus]
MHQKIGTEVLDLRDTDEPTAETEALRQRVSDLEAQVESLRAEVVTRARVAQATGILMATYRLPAGGAREMLHAAAGQHDLTPYELAVRVTEAGELPVELPQGRLPQSARRPRGRPSR